MARLHSFLGCALVLLAVGFLRAAEVMPPAPKAYFNDYAGMVTASEATAFDLQLKDFERQTSNQLVVAVFPKMESDSSIEDYTVRVAQSWHVGQKEKNNGIVLFVFRDDRKMYIQVGYGLEPVLTDAVCRNIVETKIKPQFRNQNYSGGLKAGIDAIISGTKGEYKGTGATVTETVGKTAVDAISLIHFIFMTLIILFIIYRIWSAGHLFTATGGRPYRSSGFFSGGGGFSGSGGGFSGGGGSFGGGGAGGGW